ENVIERAVVVAEGPSISVVELPAEILATEESEKDPDAWSDGEMSLIPELVGIRGEREERDRREKERLGRALAATKGNKAEAARTLGLARSTLLSRLKKHGLN